MNKQAIPCLMAILLGSCTSAPPGNETPQQLAEAAKQGGLWLRSRTAEQAWHYPDNQLKTLRIDGAPPVRDTGLLTLTPGMHRIEVSHERHRFCLWEVLGGAWGTGFCYQTEGVSTLSWQVEAGHTYMPFALYHCQRAWVWLEDVTWASREGLKQTIWPATDLHLADEISKKSGELRTVVSGERAPTACPE